MGVRWRSETVLGARRHSISLASFKRLACHRRDHFLHRQDAGRLASLLLWSAMLRDPLGDHLPLLRVRRDLGGGLLSATFFTSLEIGAEATIRFGRHQLRRANIHADVEHHATVFGSENAPFCCWRRPTHRSLQRIHKKGVGDCVTPVSLGFAMGLA
jgi:hypothetical protein